MVTFDEKAKRRIRFLTRRGLLELDLVLGRFMQTQFQSLSDTELKVFVEILDLPDPQLLAFINEKEICNTPSFLPLLDKIRQAK